MFTVGSSSKANGSLSRGVRSASTGFALTSRNQRSMDSVSDLPTVPERASSSASNPPIQSYSSLRMVRPRQTIMSPDMHRRYEQHQRFISRSKRSTRFAAQISFDNKIEISVVLQVKLVMTRKDVVKLLAQLLQLYTVNATILMKANRMMSHQKAEEINEIYRHHRQRLSQMQTLQHQQLKQIRVKMKIHRVQQTIKQLKPIKSTYQPRKP